jgi:hypothetical protein
MRSDEHRAVHVGFTLALLLAALLPLLVRAPGLPSITAGFSIPAPRCVVQNTTGRPCGTCGLTRSMAHLWRGRIQDAIILHPGGPVAAVGLALQLAIRCLIGTGKLRLGIWQDLCQLVATGLGTIACVLALSA